MGLGTTITSEPFLVLRRLDIREDAELQKTVTVNISRRMVDRCIVLCGGSIDAVFTVEKTGHLPGDDIVIDGEVDNNSRRVIKLIQVRTGARTRTIQYNLCDISTTPVAKCNCRSSQRYAMHF